MTDFKNISILEGNIFGCTDASSLPQNDNYLDSFSCGSDTFNQYMILFACICASICVAAFIYLLVHYFLSESKYKSMLYNATKDIEDYLKIFETPEVSPGLASFANTLKKVRYFTLIITAMITLLIPIYTIFKTEPAMKTYSYQYGWTPTAAFISGNSASITLLVFWLVIISIVLEKITKIFGNHATLTLSNLKNVKLLIWIRFFALTFIIAAVNAAVIVSANIAYGILLKIGSSSVQNVAGFALSVFKLIWNSVAINFLRGIRFSLTEEEYNTCMELIFGGDVIYFTLILIFNTIVAPIIATLLGESNCFRNALYAPDPILSTYRQSVQFKYSLGTGYIDSIKTYSIEFTPPFSYSYSCSSFILVDYVPVFIISAIITAFLKPLKDVVFRVLNNFTTREYNATLLKDASEITSLVSHTAGALNSRLQLLSRCPKLMWRKDEREFSIQGNKILLALKKKMTQERRSKEESTENKLEEQVQSKSFFTKLLGYSSMIVFAILNSVLDIYNSIFNDIDQDHDSQIEQIFDFESFVLTILTKLFIIMTFGVMCPILAIATAISIILPCWYLQLLVGRYISLIQESNIENESLMKILERDCDGKIFDISINQIRFSLIFFTSLFMAAFLFDMIGDQQGWRNALVYPFVMLGVGCALLTIHSYFKRSTPLSSKIYIVSSDDDISSNDAPITKNNENIITVPTVVSGSIITTLEKNIIDV